MVENKNIRAPQTYCLCIQQEQKYTGCTEIKFVIAMEDNDDWLANNKTWKKWTRIGDGELLSYAGINFHKPIDEERLIKNQKKEKLNDRKLDNDRKQAVQKRSIKYPDQL